MPLIKNSDLPTFDRLTAEGRQVLDIERAQHQDIRELHVGFLNLMPDAALEATERQFFRLVGESNRIVQIHIHPFTLPMIKRGPEAQTHIDKYYESYETLQKEGLDALVITGTNAAACPDFSDTAFWRPLVDVLDWAYENVTSTLCACLTTHVCLHFLSGQTAMWHEKKRFGVFSHRVVDKAHPLVSEMNTLFNVVHARHRDVSREQFEAADMRILVESPEAGVHMATSKDGFRRIFMQGHPEYDTLSILKEWRRDVQFFAEGKIPECPPVPHGYLTGKALGMAQIYVQDVLAGKKDSVLPEAEIAALVDNTWRDSARAAIGTWIGYVYQITHNNRKIPFMDGVDLDDPLELKKSK